MRARLARIRAGGQILPVLETPAFDPSLADPKDRFESPPANAELAEVGLAPEAWLLCGAAEAVSWAWPYLARGPGTPGPVVLARYDGSSDAAPVADLAAFAAHPGSHVAAPRDAAATQATIDAILSQPAPTYARIPTDPGPARSEARFQWGTAPVLREGSDLTLIGVGPVLTEVEALADRLQGVGVSARVLDGASVKPLDAVGVLRAARETGAILTAEQHNVVSGYGAAVAAVTALGYPVPVRRLGVPDLPAAALGGPAVSAARLDEEAWELLKARGKVQ